MISDSVPRVQYTGNGATLAFAFGQKFYSLTEFQVYRLVISTNVETLVDPSLYTVSGTPLSSGGYSAGTITFGIAPTSDHRITILRSGAYAQENDYVANTGFPSDAHENAMDKIVMLLQEMRYAIQRCVKQVVSATTEIVFPSAQDGKVLGWDAGGNLVNKEPALQGETGATGPQGPQGAAGVDGGAVEVLLTDGATPALDASLGNAFILTASGDRTIAIPTNPSPGKRFIIRHKASGGARTLALNTSAGGFRFGSTVTGLTQTASGKTDYIGVAYNSVDGYWDVLAYSKGF